MNMKKSNELMAAAYSKLYSIPATGLRFFTVYGPMGRERKARRRYGNAVLMTMAALSCVTTAFAAGGDPLSIVNNLSDFIFSIIKALGVIILGWGIVQVGMSIQSHDASQRTQGFLCLFGGLLIAFAKEILTAIGAI